MQTKITKPSASKPRKKYFNRELSWLSFNGRVMEEAQNADYPLLERLRFLSISADNLDEFYMVRVAGLRTQVLAGMRALSLDGLSAGQQLDKIRKSAGVLIKRQQDQWKTLRSDLYAAGIKVKETADLSTAEREKLRDIYRAEVKPLLTPLALDPAHPFPFIPNLGFGLVLSLRHPSEAESRKALVTIPAHVPRFICLHQSASRKQQTYRAFGRHVKIICA